MDRLILGILMHPPYIGILGPKKKLERMLDELEEEGTVIPETNLETIHGPVGLDISSETSEEIALAIVAEIKAVFSKRNGHSLKYKTTVIHSAQSPQLSYSRGVNQAVWDFPNKHFYTKEKLYWNGLLKPAVNQNATG